MSQFFGRWSWFAYAQAVPGRNAYAQAGCRRRMLRLESLEPRYALSAAAMSDVDPCLNYEPTTLATQPLVDTAESPDAELDSEFVGPLEADTYYAAIGDSPLSATSVAQEGEEYTYPDGSAPPEMRDFGAERVSMYWVLSGYVSDDLPPENCVVEFGGYLAGHTAGVMSDGYFSTFVFYNPNVTYEVTAVARDSNGNLSNMMSVILAP